MQQIHTTRPSNDSAQYVFAVFDNWETLQTVTEELAARAPNSSPAVLARRDSLPIAVSCEPLKSAVDLHFAQSHHRISCTSGRIAERLSKNSASGIRSLSDALHSWLSSDQSWQLQRHVEEGHLVLWMQPTTAEEFDAVCGRLVQASPHIVGICNMNT
jgi:hypothetical protein